jgi:hypothetical protein
MMKDLADILAEAREYIETHGWWRGALVGPNGRQVCSIGAIVYSQGWVNPYNHQQYDPAYEMELGRVSRAMLAAIRGHSIPLRCLSDWNDNWAENKQEVLDTFARAEKIARAGYDPDA